MADYDWDTRQKLRLPVLMAKPPYDRFLALVLGFSMEGIEQGRSILGELQPLHRHVSIMVGDRTLPAGAIERHWQVKRGIEVFFDFVFGFLPSPPIPNDCYEDIKKFMTRTTDDYGTENNEILAKVIIDIGKIVRKAELALVSTP